MYKNSYFELIFDVDSKNTNIYSNLNVCKNILPESFSLFTI